MTSGRFLVLAGALVVGCAVARAQTAPAQNGNVYNGTAHEPNPAATTQQEQAAGVALPPQQQQQTTNTVEQLGKQIQQRAATPTGTAAGCSASQKVCPP